MDFALFRSLRFRLVATFVAVVGIINAILGLGGVVVREWQLRNRFDAQLLEYANRIALYRQRTAAVDAESPGGLLADPDRPFVNADLYVQLRDASGEVMEASTNLRGRSLPLPEEALGPLSLRVPVFQTVEGPVVRELAGEPRAIRVVTRRLAQPGLPDAILQVARSLDEVEESLAFMRTLFWVVMPAGLFAAALSGWLVTGRTLGRLNVISQLASGMTPEHLDRRIEEQGSGDEISKVVAELNHMLGRLERSFNAQERFIANASHELQTPVAVLLSEAQRLQRREATPEEHREFLRTVEQQMRQLSRMVGSLLSLTRMESGDLVRTGKLLPLQELLVEAVDHCCPQAHESGVTVTLRLPEAGGLEGNGEPEGEALVRGDPELLKIMLENLLRNGVRYSRRGQRVEASLDLDADQAIITVTDQGPTIPEDAIRSIFNRSRAAAVAGEGDERRGAGLGLAIAQTVAELHGGALGVRNQPGEGVAFFVWLPLADEPAAVEP